MLILLCCKIKWNGTYSSVALDNEFDLSMVAKDLHMVSALITRLVEWIWWSLLYFVDHIAILQTFKIQGQCHLLSV